MVETQAHRVRSPDGTMIAFWSSGAGAPLLLVHGTSADHTRWPAVLPFLEKAFLVLAMDRRGRGSSPDSVPYSLGREAEDIAAIVDEIGQPVHLLGHSYGALCALEATLLTGKVDRLVLYEPFLPTPEHNHPAGVAERIEAMVSAGDRDEAVAMMFRQLAGMPDADIEALRALPSWERRLEAAHTIARETRAEEEYRFAPSRFAALAAPTLMLVGGDSPRFLVDASAIVAAALPNSRTVTMAGQQHIAMNTAPALFAREVIAFLTPSAMR